MLLKVELERHNSVCHHSWLEMENYIKITFPGTLKTTLNYIKLQQILKIFYIPFNKKKAVFYNLETFITSPENSFPILLPWSQRCTTNNSSNEQVLIVQVCINYLHCQVAGQVLQENPGFEEGVPINF